MRVQTRRRYSRLLLLLIPIGWFLLSFITRIKEDKERGVPRKIKRTTFLPPIILLLDILEYKSLTIKIIIIISQ